jgi:hypothetical protein
MLCSPCHTRQISSSFAIFAPTVSTRDKGEGSDSVDEPKRFAALVQLTFGADWKPMEDLLRRNLFELSIYLSTTFV